MTDSAQHAAADWRAPSPPQVGASAPRSLLGVLRRESRLMRGSVGEGWAARSRVAVRWLDGDDSPHTIDSQRRR